MKILLARILFVFFILTTGVAFAEDIRDVSLIQLIANPELFNGKAVRVIGYMHLEFEGDAVYFHREDFEYTIHKNSLAIDLNEAQVRLGRKLNNGYVIIEGRFNSVANGHLGVRAGSIENITRLGNWSVNRASCKENQPL